MPALRHQLGIMAVPLGWDSVIGFRRAVPLAPDGSCGEDDAPAKPSSPAPVALAVGRSEPAWQETVSRVRPDRPSPSSHTGDGHDAALVAPLALGSVERGIGRGEQGLGSERNRGRASHAHGDHRTDR